MVRQRIVLAVVIALIATPAAALSLPRGGAEEQSVPGGETRVWSQSLDADSNASVDSPSLQPNRFYRIHIFGEWFYDVDLSSNNRADAAYHTDDNWVTQQSGPDAPSLEIDGQRLSADPPGYDDDHVYSISVVGRDIGGGTGQSIRFRIFDPDDDYSNNSGNLTVELWQLKKIAWHIVTEAEVPGGSVTTPHVDSVTTTAIDSEETPGTDPVPLFPGASETVYVPPTTIPELRFSDTIRVAIRHYPNPDSPNMCLFVGVGDRSDQRVEPCVIDPWRYGTYFSDLNDRSNGRLGEKFPTSDPENSYPQDRPSQTICTDPPGCYFDITVPAVGIPGVPSLTTPPIESRKTPEIESETVTTPIPPGSKLVIELTWQARVDKLFLLGQGQALGNNVSAWAPFDFRSEDEWMWFLSSQGLPDVDLELTYYILLPPDEGCTEDDPCYFIFPTTYKLPGMGQFLEAAFATRTDATD